MKKLKNAEEYLEELFDKPYNLEEGSIESDFLKTLKKAQLDTIQTTVENCTEEAKVKHAFISTGDYSGYSNYIIDKQSILNVFDKMKGDLDGI